MVYRMRVQLEMDWVGPGAGPMQALAAPMLTGGGSTGQTLEVVSKVGGYVLAGTGAGTDPNKQLAAADITTLLAQLSTDMSTQLNANIATMQGWVSGNP